MRYQEWRGWERGRYQRSVSKAAGGVDLQNHLRIRRPYFCRCGFGVGGAGKRGREASPRAVEDPRISHGFICFILNQKNLNQKNGIRK